MDESEENIEFQLRSDFIQTEDLLQWNVVNEHFTNIQNQLKSTGTKLLVGPRGSGKTHQMKIFQENCKTDTELPLCIYISFTRYLYLEPYLSKRNNALQIFHSWVLAKAVLACFEIKNETAKFNEFLSSAGFTFDLDKLIDFIAQAERGILNENDDAIFSELSIASLVKLIELFREDQKRKRTVILFDDAALTLTQDYLVELFDIIRSVKTKTISPKASVYPGSTEYGPRFHVGHDADEVICWMNITDSTYSTFMSSLVSQRFSSITEQVPENILEIFKYASFGIPRGFISLIQNYIHGGTSTQQSKYNKALEKQEEFIKSEYQSLVKKMPQFKRVLEVGNAFFDSCADLLTQMNTGLNDTKQLVIGIEEGSVKEIRLYPRMKQLLYEAGLIYDLGNVSHGTDRTYNRFAVHTLFLLKNRAFSGSSRGFNPSAIITRLTSSDEKHPLRKTITQVVNETILSELKLDFPSCPKCNAARIVEDQFFCHVCGSELVKLSVFEECLKVSVDELSITQWEKTQLKNNGYNSIADFVSKKDPASSLRAIYRIGQVKAEKITNTVDAYITEFLS